MTVFRRFAAPISFARFSSIKWARIFLGPIKQGNRYANRHSEIFRQRQGLRLHHQRGRRQRCLRPHFRGRSGRDEHARKGAAPVLRARERQERQVERGEPAERVTAAAVYCEIKEGGCRGRPPSFFICESERQRVIPALSRDPPCFSNSAATFGSTPG